MILYLKEDLLKAKAPSARAPKSVTSAPATPTSGSTVADAGGKAGAATPMKPSANTAPRAPSARAKTGVSNVPNTPTATPEEKPASTEEQLVTCPLGAECPDGGEHHSDSAVLVEHQGIAARKGQKGTAAPQGEQSTQPDLSPPVLPPIEEDIKSNSTPGQHNARKDPDARYKDPQHVQMHTQHMQEFSTGARDQEHHQLINAMTPGEHKAASKKYAAAGATDLAAMHSQAELTKPRSADVINAHKNTPEGDRRYSPGYLDNYISHTARYLQGGPGGSPEGKFSEVHSMTPDQHQDLATKLEAGGAKTAANKHRRIAAMKSTFKEKEAAMVANKPKPGPKAKPKKQEEPSTPSDAVKDFGSNILSHLTNNHDMDPADKMELMQTAKQAQKLHESGDDVDGSKLAALQAKAGKYGESAYNGRKGMPGQRYMSKFSTEDLEAHAEFAQASGNTALADRYKAGARNQRETANLQGAKEAAKQDKASLDSKLRESAQADKADAKAKNQASRADIKAKSADAKRLAAAPHLPGDHDEYKKHAANHNREVKDFLQGNDVSPEVRAKVENAQKVISAHAQLGSQATPQQRRELSDAMKITTKHMDEANKDEQFSDDDPEAAQKKQANQKLSTTFNRWWGQGSSVAAATAKDQTAGSIVSTIPHAAASTAVHTTESVLKDSDKNEEKPADENPSEKRKPMTKGLYLDLSKAVNSPNMGGVSPTDEEAAKESDRIGHTQMTGVGGGHAAKSPSKGDETSKSLFNMQELLKSMRNNLHTQLDNTTNTASESQFLISKGYDRTEAKYNTKLMNKSLLRKEYSSWLMNKLEKSLSSIG